MPSRADNLIRQKSMDYAVRIYHLNEYLIQQKKFTLADQVFRSGTSIGANISEAIKAESDADFVHKHSIAQYMLIVHNSISLYKLIVWKS